MTGRRRDRTAPASTGRQFELAGLEELDAKSPPLRLIQSCRNSGWQNQPMPNLLRSQTIAILAATPITAALSLFSAGIGSAEPLNCASGQFWDPITNTCQTPQPAQDCAAGEYWNALSNVCRPLGQL